MADIKFQKKINYLEEGNAFSLSNEFISGVDVIKQKILIRLNIYRGEWAADLGLGIPMNAVAQNSQDPVTVAQIYADEILQVTGVTSVRVTNLEINQTNRLIEMTFLVNTIYNQAVSVTTNIASQ